MKTPTPDPLPLKTKTRWGILMSRREINGELHYVMVEPRCVSVVPAEVVEASVAFDLAQLENQRSAKPAVRETQGDA